MKSTTSRVHAGTHVRRKLAGVMLAGACLSLTSTRGNFFLDLSVTASGGGVYHYAASVANAGPEDLALVTLTDAPAHDPFLAPSLLAPAGFQASYDSGAGFLDFLADLSFPPGATIDGFSFDSGAAPGTAFNLVEALDTAGGPVSGQVRYRVAGVPDSVDSLAAILAGLGAISVWRRGLGHGRPTSPPAPRGAVGT